MKYFSGAVALLLIVGVCVADARAEVSGLAAVETDLTLRILGAEPGVFGVVKKEAALDAVVEYHLADGVVSFNISDRIVNSLDNPLFCFDYSDAASPVNLEVNSMGGAVALPGIGIGSALQYSLSSNEILVSPHPSVQCFYYGFGDTPEFGLFGVAPLDRSSDTNEPDNDQIFDDGFEAQMMLSLSFVGVPETARSGDSLSYVMVLANEGQGNVSGVALQEVFPADVDFYPAILSGAWTCEACPEESTVGSGPIRQGQLNLAPGEELRFVITRTIVGQQAAEVRLHAGAVAGPGSKALFDVATASITVVE